MNYTQANIGDKVKFKGGKLKFWFLDMIGNAEKLDKNKEYTISEIRVYSSWAGVILKETGYMYNLGWFEKI